MCVSRYSIAKNPPVELTQLYYKCTQEWGESLFNAVGIASGNIGNVQRNMYTKYQLFKPDML